MKTEIIELKKLIASEGMILTNGTAYGREAYLGCNDSTFNWWEITEEEYNKIQEEKQKALEEEGLLYGPTD